MKHGTSFRSTGKSVMCSKLLTLSGACHHHKLSTGDRRLGGGRTVLRHSDRPARLRGHTAGVRTQPLGLLRPTAKHLRLSEDQAYKVSRLAGTDREPKHIFAASASQRWTSLPVECVANQSRIVELTDTLDVALNLSSPSQYRLSVHSLILEIIAVIHYPAFYK